MALWNSAMIICGMKTTSFKGIGDAASASRYIPVNEGDLHIAEKQENRSFVDTLKHVKEPVVFYKLKHAEGQNTDHAKSMVFTGPHTRIVTEAGGSHELATVEERTKGKRAMLRNKHNTV